MLKRKIYSQIKDFYNNNHNKALLITGARQVGKSYIIKKYGEENYKNFIILDFIQDSKYVDIFNNAKDDEDILLRLSSIYGDKLEKGNTLIFFDEVQECEKIIEQIKYLVQEGSYNYILSGSLLGVKMKDYYSQPVGYLSILKMFPLDFEEFAIANGLSEKVFDSLEDSFINKTLVDEFVHKRMMELFELYMIIGGMPASVNKYIETNNLYLVSQEQESIINLYKKDISKYDKENKLYIEDIYSIIPNEINSKNKRFILKNLNEYTKFNKFANSFIWLMYAGVALPTFIANEPTSPLLLNKQTNQFKLFMNDVGLLSSVFGADTQINILNKQTSINFGAIYENIVAEELNSHGYELFYYNNKKNGEVDFLIENNNEIIPIEVKSGKDYIRHKAMDNLLNIYPIKEGYVLCNSNIKVDNKVTYYPIYMIMFIKKKEIDKNIIFSKSFTDINDAIK